MDSLTQAALGAAIGQATLGKRIGRKGALAGALVATIPDLDVLLRVLYSSYDMLRIHRGISHSLLFGVVGALVLSLIFKRTKLFSQVSLIRLWWFNGLCLITHSLLDFCTSYGTQLFLPFSDTRLGIDIVNVVDPVYTIPLLLGTLGGLIIPQLKPNMFRWNAMGLAVSSLYLVFTFMVKMNVNERVEADLASQDIRHTHLLTMPVGAASINWYGVATTDNGIYMKKYTLFPDENESFEFFPQNDSLLGKLTPEVANTMRWFAKGFYTAETVGDTIRIYNLQVDMRGMVLDRSPHAPTKGFFEFVRNDEGVYEYGYGNMK
ncbi:MAG TPA: metal-dependent hydrolase [Flavobacteriales bacterium]|nr:metal-dependent hydrolase [Flavobacteriales bacterium]